MSNINTVCYTEFFLGNNFLENTAEHVLAYNLQHFLYIFFMWKNFLGQQIKYIPLCLHYKVKNIIDCLERDIIVVWTFISLQVKEMHFLIPLRGIKNFLLTGVNTQEHHNQRCPQIPDHPYRILIVGGYGL